MCCHRLIIAFGLLSACYGVKLSSFCRDVFFYGDDLNQQSGFNQSNISYYDRQYIEELKL